jgi:hypothetical protein
MDAGGMKVEAPLWFPLEKQPSPVVFEDGMLNFENPCTSLTALDNEPEVPCVPQQVKVQASGVMMIKKGVFVGNLPSRLSARDIRAQLGRVFADFKPRHIKVKKNKQHWNGYLHFAVS